MKAKERTTRGSSQRIAREQARLRKPQRDGRSRLHTWSVGDTGIGVEARRHVDRYHRQAGGIDAFNPFGELAFGPPAEARAEDRVNDRLSTVQPEVVQDLDPDPPQCVQLRGRGAPQPAGVKAADACQLSPAVKMSRRGQAVSSVVADSTHHSRRGGAKAGHLPAGGLHQPVHRDAEALLRERVDPFDLRASQRG